MVKKKKTTFETVNFKGRLDVPCQGGTPNHFEGHNGQEKEGREACEVEGEDTSLLSQLSQKNQPWKKGHDSIIVLVTKMTNIYFRMIFIEVINGIYTCLSKKNKNYTPYSIEGLLFFSYVSMVHGIMQPISLYY